MSRYALAVEYDGTDFNGWQVQPDGRSVQATLERGLAAVAAAKLQVICAGRTDTGVHATYQVVHFDTEAGRTEHQWCAGTNANLPADLAVLWCRPVDDDFHARFSALRRRYSYLILNRGSRSALNRRRCAWVHRRLDAERMLEAAQYLLGEHDFSAFRTSQCQAKSPVRNVSAVSVDRYADWVCITVEANAFLHNMVRIIAGSLIRVGRGDAEPGWIREILAARDRAHRGATAPPQGLYLNGIDYPERYALPASTPLTVALPRSL